jgi:hypothetical protein
VANNFWSQNQNERGHFEERGLNRIFRWIMKKMCRRCMLTRVILLMRGYAVDVFEFHCYILSAFFSLLFVLKYFQVL